MKAGIGPVLKVFPPAPPIENLANLSSTDRENDSPPSTVDLEIIGIVLPELSPIRYTQA